VTHNPDATWMVCVPHADGYVWIASFVHYSLALDYVSDHCVNPIIVLWTW